MRTKRLTVAQATILYLQQQYVERDGIEQQFFAGCFGIFGHGNVGGIGQALAENPSFKYYQSRNEQAMVHAAIAYAKVKNRMSAFACTSSIGPGATNMVTGAATATINRLPVLLLPGDIFSTRHVDPVLQQLECGQSNDISVNDCFKPVSKYWDRINRPEQLIAALPKVMRVLTSPSETGAVTLCMPQDVQAEAYDFPTRLFEKKVWLIPRTRCDSQSAQEATNLILSSTKPVIIAGGGVHYSGAENTLKAFVEATGIPVIETYAGKGSLNFDHPLNIGAAGVTGTPGAISLCKDADLVIGIGTRYSDFTSVSQSAFQNAAVKFVNINACDFDAFKQGALALVGDAKVTLDELAVLLAGYKVSSEYSAFINSYHQTWSKKVAEIYAVKKANSLRQGEIIGAVNQFSAPKDIVLCAAGSLPGDLHRLWQTRNPKGFHLEYGYSCMGYEIAGGLGAKMADPTREVYVMVGDGSYLMMAQEIITSIQEGYKITIILINNHGYASIGGLSKSLGTNGFGTSYQFRQKDSGQLDGAILPVNLAANAQSLGATVIKIQSADELFAALHQAKQNTTTTVIYVETNREDKEEGYSWWDVPVAEITTMPDVKKSRDNLNENRKKQQYYL